ncbi:MAG: NAD(P)-binding domain-containing protein [Caldilineaceae bacterium]|nr:NAD(P)-binding domain-containing protein [Caldilineaceae bacterium]MBP8110043.1 NAD(P)-binding domain-containing protein [Caldilineaceae bacterium]MBP8125019.1 NAD(P)-binding domain-containing protein [Caldilineaceae bacterium]MBP9074780.1 NAD(P)-binding domain-containing protein [Caldilineaceae bacterium]
MTTHSDLLIIGAGPFGLSLAAQAQIQGVDYTILGKPMEFWRANMPEGMYLRSASDWHLDPVNIHTIEAFLAEQGKTPADVEPLSLDFYLSYARWFREQKRISITEHYAKQVDRVESGGFLVTLENGESITAAKVAVALGFSAFKHEPAEMVDLLPPNRYAHTCDFVDFAPIRGKRCLILGGRQSAFEWAALLNEAGAAQVHISHRHDSPAFEEADWSWVNPLVDAMVDNPGWFRHLSDAEKDKINHRLWAEGRLKVEPWLEDRVMTPTTTLWPRTRLTGCVENADGSLDVVLAAVDGSDERHLRVDQVILATGYKVHIDRVRCLNQGNLLTELATRNGFPVLDEHFQTNIPGLFITSLPAAQDFGPFFGFTISVRTSARLIGQAL